MKKRLVLSAVLAGICTLLFASPPTGEWLTDAKAAMSRAKEKKLPVFALFTGSDWCPYCKKLAENVLQTQQFQDFAKGKLILLYLDFPHKQKLPPPLARQNKEWGSRYRITGFPTVLLLDADGREIGRIPGYSPMQDFIEKLKGCLERGRRGRH